MNFNILNKDTETQARAGLIDTEHGTIETPVFMPVGTLGSVKTVHQRELEQDIKAQIILGNTYHLYLRPGIDILKQAGGLHKFINWNKPILTDSGGYQVFSLSGNRKISKEGVVFRSHIDGSKHNFSPENVMDIQRVIGADIIMAFDECPPWPADYKYVKNSMNITHEWLLRCKTRLKETDNLYGYNQTLFPIVQGGTYGDLRKESAEFIAAQNCDGNAIGGLSVGEPAEEMYKMIEITAAILPFDKPRYLMGVGTPVNMLEAIALGVDMFDCVMPTRNARNGMLFTGNGIINIKNKKWQSDFSQIDEDNHSYVDSQYSKAYLRHLFIAKEVLGLQIASIHNLGFYVWLMQEARKQIINNTFNTWKHNMIKKLSQRL